MVVTEERTEITSDARCMAKVKNRIGKAKDTFKELDIILRNQKLPFGR